MSVAAAMILLIYISLCVSEETLIPPLLPASITYNRCVRRTRSTSHLPFSCPPGWCGRPEHPPMRRELVALVVVVGSVTVGVARKSSKVAMILC